MTYHPEVCEDPGIVAVGIREETYFDEYAHDFHEFSHGEVIRLSPVHMRHDRLNRFLAFLFEMFLERFPYGEIRQAPFLMRLSASVSREPDLMIVLNENLGRLSPTRMNGGADIVIEIVSFESRDRDYKTKRDEYERFGVVEYWLFDPMTYTAIFHRRNAAGLFEPQEMSKGVYTTPLLPSFALDVAVLWREPLPGPAALLQMVAAME